MKDIVDTPPDYLIPYLIHFGEKRITPKVLGVEGGEALRLEKVPGRRLGMLLQDENDPGPLRLREIYSVLGRHVGYIAKFNVIHTDLHTENVVVEDDYPIIVDWERGECHPFLNSDPMYWHGHSSDLLLKTTKVRLEQAEFPQMYEILQRYYTDAFLEELNTHTEIDKEELYRKANKMGWF